MFKGADWEHYSEVNKRRAVIISFRHWRFGVTRWQLPSPSRHSLSTWSPITVDIFSSWARNRNNNYLGAFPSKTEIEDSCAHVTRIRTKTEKEITHKMSYEQTACDGNHNIINFQILWQVRYDTYSNWYQTRLTIDHYFIMFITLHSSYMIIYISVLRVLQSSILLDYLG